MAEARSSAATARALITAASANGVTSDTDGAISVTAWSEIARIMAVTVAYGAAHIMLLIFETRGGQFLFLSEVDSAWSDTTNKLHTFLRNAVPFSDWGGRLIAGASLTEVWRAEP